MDNPYKAPTSELELDNFSETGVAIGNLDPLAEWTPASSAQRVGAYIIDGFLMAFAMVALSVGLVVLGALAGVPEIFELVPEQLLGMIMMLPVAVIFGMMESSSMQGSLGKKVLGLRVITVDGYDLDQQTAMKRNFIKFLGLSICGLLSFTALGGTGKSLWDKQASTRVVKRKTHSDGVGLGL